MARSTTPKSEDAARAAKQARIGAAEKTKLDKVKKLRAKGVVVAKTGQLSDDDIKVQARLALLTGRMLIGGGGSVALTDPPRADADIKDRVRSDKDPIVFDTEDDLHDVGVFR